MSSNVTNCVLTDIEQNIWESHHEVHGASGGGAGCRPWSISKRVLHGGLRDRVDIIEIDNGALTFTVVPTRGMGIWRGEYDGCRIGWRSPVAGPVNPLFVKPQENGGLGWLQGFDEMVCRCGLISNGPPGTDIVPDNNGNPQEMQICLHGRIANTPASRVEIEVIETDRTELIIKGVVDQGMLFFPRLRLVTRISTIVGSNCFTIRDEIINMGGTETEMELLYHCNFGEPFLGAGATLVAPSKTVVPRDPRAAEDAPTYAVYAPPTPGYVEQCYFHQLAGNANGDTVTLLRSPDGGKGIVLRHNLNELPCFTQWKNTAATADGYVTGLEPGVNLPNPKVYERRNGRVPKLGPGESRRAALTIGAVTDAAAVKAVEAEIAAIRGGDAPTVHLAAQPGWSPAGE